MEKKPFTGRITRKRLIELVNDLFDKYEITQYRCVDIISTKYTSDQYEGGACKLHIKFNDIESIKNNQPFHGSGTLLCFYFMKEIEEHLKSGYELYLYTNSRFGGRSVSLTELELDLKKTK